MVSGASIGYPKNIGVMSAQKHRKVLMSWCFCTGFVSATLGDHNASMSLANCPETKNLVEKTSLLTRSLLPYSHGGTEFDKDQQLEANQRKGWRIHFSCWGYESKRCSTDRKGGKYRSAIWKYLCHKSIFGLNYHRSYPDFVLFRISNKGYLWLHFEIASSIRSLPNCVFSIKWILFISLFSFTSVRKPESVVIFTKVHAAKVEKCFHGIRPLWNFLDGQLFPHFHSKLVRCD